MKVETAKVCTKCGVEKPLGQFYKAPSGADGLRGDCKACVGEQRRAYYQDNRERKAEYNRAWYATNRERKAETQRAWYEANRESADEYRRVWGKANPEKVAEYDAHYRVKHPDRAAARSEVTKAVMRGDFPPASALVCDHCQEAQAEHWHHHLGYEPEHALDVIPVCIPCHVELDRET